MDTMRNAELARKVGGLAEAAAALAEAARGLARFLSDEGGAELVLDRGAAGVVAEGWVSPTRTAEPEVIHGEDDLPAALERSSMELVIPGTGGFVAGVRGAGERLRLLALTLAGDAALEVRHAGIEGDQVLVDEAIDQVHGVLTATAEAVGLALPREVFLEGLVGFEELVNRGGQWR